MNLVIELPKSINEAIEEHGEEIVSKLKRGDLIIVDWNDAADERQVVIVKREKIETPVHTGGFYYDVVDNREVVVNLPYQRKTWGGMHILAKSGLEKRAGLFTQEWVNAILANARR